MSPQRTITVTIDVSAESLRDYERLVDGDPAEPISATIHMGIPADSEAEAIVEALRKSADVTANRFGRPDLFTCPPVVDQLLTEMTAARQHAGLGEKANDLLLGWSRLLANQHGMILTEDAPSPAPAMVNGDPYCRCRGHGVDPAKDRPRCMHARTCVDLDLPAGP